MTAHPLVVLALLELKNKLFVALELIQNFCHNFGCRSLFRIGLYFFTVYYADGLQFNRLANFNVKLLNIQLVAWGNFILFATGFYDCVHTISSTIYFNCPLYNRIKQLKTQGGIISAHSCPVNKTPWVLRYFYLI